ncbi:metadherin a isoform 5-T5 [Odontesthes bonariensis]|uniref:metadherin a isoform X5 n=1 Tax=Odontesthes bonariensis TaxID=219752 RepID=UPI003F583C81
MAEDLRGLALEKAELLSSRLKELVSSGQGYVRAQFGVDLGLKPELYPTWVILSTALVGVLLLLGVSWAAVCGRLLFGKKRGSPVTHGSGEPEKANFITSSKPEEQRKRNKKKTLEKKTQSNGQPVTAVREEAKVAEVVSKLAPEIKAGKAHEVQAPVQVKKNKKKTKSDVKPVQHVPKNDGKELDDGAWETKVSNREKKQQRRKEKGPGDSGGTGGVDTPKTHVEAPVARVPSKKNRGNHEAQHLKTTAKGDAASGAVLSATSTWKEEPSVNGGGWSNMSSKITAWGSIDGRVKADLRPASFSVIGLNTTDTLSNSAELQWANQHNVDDQWSGFNGMTAGDPSSDWNAPVEHWGNYEVPPVPVAPAPLQRDQPVPSKVSEDEKDVEDPSGGAAKSKKNRKKKKKTEEPPASDAQTASTAGAVTKAQELPVLPSKKQNNSISSSQKKSEQVVEPPKPSQKKKVRRET